jgi:group I intron endonuclease
MGLKYDNFLSARLPTTPGVYKFANKINGKVYIGKSVGIHRRLSAIRNNDYFKRDGGKFFNAIKKYGWENFSLEIIELYPSRTPFIEKYILEREAFWIRFYKATNENFGYNFTEYASDWTGRKHTPETVLKLRGQKRSDEARKKMSEAKKGIARTEEEKQKLRDYYKTHKNPNFGKKFPEQGKIKQALFGHKIKQINPTTGEILKIWPSIREASRKYSPDGSNANISAAIKRKRIAYGFEWVRVPKEELL